MSNLHIFDPRVSIEIVRQLSERVAAEVAPQLEIVGVIPAEGGGDACEILARDDRRVTSLMVFRFSRRGSERAIRGSLQERFSDYSERAV